MKSKMTIMILALALTACAPTMTPVPTAIPPTIAPTASATLVPPTPIPSMVPPPIFTPDAVQVARWREYQLELAKVLLAGYPTNYEEALCEWDILGRSGLEVYVWAYCETRLGSGASRPAIIELGADGSIQDMRVPGFIGAFYDLSIFPPDVRKKCALYMGSSRFAGRLKEMMDHIDFREAHPEEPPLIVLSATPAP